MSSLNRVKKKLDLHSKQTGLPEIKHEEPTARYEIVYTKLDSAISLDQWNEFVQKSSVIIHSLFRKICGGE